MGCPKEIAKQIIGQKSDYILTLKGNHSGIQNELDAAQREGFTVDNHAEYTLTDSGHGRIETRACQQILINTKWLAKNTNGIGLKSIIKVTLYVYEKPTGKESTETRWHIRSLNLNALHATRNHWQVESMHWMLDMTFREDESRIKMRSR